MVHSSIAAGIFTLVHVLRSRLVVCLVVIIMCISISYNSLVSASNNAAIHDSSVSARQEGLCPICFRVIKAARDYAKAHTLPTSIALEKYCAVTNIEVEEQKFCYNIDNMKRDINKLLEYGADESRICKKINSINPDFCVIKQTKPSVPAGIHINERYKRGIIYI